jgi:hypothetical protein
MITRDLEQGGESWRKNFYQGILESSPVPLLILSPPSPILWLSGRPLPHLTFALTLTSIKDIKEVALLIALSRKGKKADTSQSEVCLLNFQHPQIGS